MSLQMALQEHCQQSFNQPVVMQASVDGIEVMGLMGIESQVEASLGGIVELVTAWLKNSDLMPSKAEVLAWVGEAFDTYIAVRPPFAGRPVITRLARQGLMTLVSSLYDSL